MCAPAAPAPGRARARRLAARRIQNQREGLTTWCARTRARACVRREQGWLCARLSDTVHIRVVAVGHRWCAGAGAVGGGARAV